MMDYKPLERIVKTTALATLFSSNYFNRPVYAQDVDNQGITYEYSAVLFCDKTIYALEETMSCHVSLHAIKKEQLSAGKFKTSPYPIDSYDIDFFVVDASAMDDGRLDIREIGDKNITKIQQGVQKSFDEPTLLNRVEYPNYEIDLSNPEYSLTSGAYAVVVNGVIDDEQIATTYFRFSIEKEPQQENEDLSLQSSPSLTALTSRLPEPVERASSPEPQQEGAQATEEPQSSQPSVPTLEKFYGVLMPWIDASYTLNDKIVFNIDLSADEIDTSTDGYVVPTPIPVKDYNINVYLMDASGISDDILSDLKSPEPDKIIMQQAFQKKFKKPQNLEGVEYEKFGIALSEFLEPKYDIILGKDYALVISGVIDGNTIKTKYKRFSIEEEEPTLVVAQEDLNAQQEVQKSEEPQQAQQPQQAQLLQQPKLQTQSSVLVQTEATAQPTQETVEQPAQPQPQQAEAAAQVPEEPQQAQQPQQADMRRQTEQQQDIQSSITPALEEYYRGAKLGCDKQEYTLEETMSCELDVYAEAGEISNLKLLPVKDYTLNLFLVNASAMDDNILDQPEMVDNNLTKTQLVFKNKFELPTTLEGIEYPNYEIDLSNPEYSLTPGAYAVVVNGFIDNEPITPVSFKFAIEKKYNPLVERGTRLAYSKNGLFKTRITIPYQGREQGKLSYIIYKLTVPENFRIKFRSSLSDEDILKSYQEEFKLCGAYTKINGKKRNKIEFKTVDIQSCLEVKAGEAKKLKNSGERQANWLLRFLRGTDVRLAQAGAQRSLEGDLDDIVRDNNGRPMADNTGMAFHRVYDPKNNLIGTNQFMFEVGTPATSRTVAFLAGAATGATFGAAMIPLIIGGEAPVPPTQPEEPPKEPPEEPESSGGFGEEGNVAQ